MALGSSLLVIAAIMWAAVAWTVLKQYAARNDRPELWDDADAIAGVVGALILAPELVLNYPEAYEYGYLHAFYRLSVFWLWITLQGWICSMWWECESDFDTPRSLRPIEDRWIDG